MAKQFMNRIICLLVFLQVFYRVIVLQSFRNCVTTSCSVSRILSLLITEIMNLNSFQILSSKSIAPEKSYSEEQRSCCEKPRISPGSAFCSLLLATPKSFPRSRDHDKRMRACILVNKMYLSSATSVVGSNSQEEYVKKEGF